MNAEKYAKQHGYDSVKYLGRWKGHDVYEAVMDLDDGIPVTGIPVFILCRGVDVRMSTMGEAMKIMDHFEQ